MIPIDLPTATLIVGGLVSAIIVLWRLDVSKNRREAARLDRCEERHAEKDEKIAKIQEEVKSVEGEYRYLCGRMDGIEQLSASVENSLSSIAKANNKILSVVEKQNLESK